MIRLSAVGMDYPTTHGKKTVFDNLNLTIAPSEKIGILGGNGAGKSTLIRLISGAELPTRGSVNRTMTVSWPLAFSGGFQTSLTGIDNLKFICRVYGVEVADKIDFVRDFTELGRELREPMRSYSSGMRAKLAFAISLSIDFDCFLIDEVVAVGDARFQRKCHHELFEKRRNRALIFVSHHPAYIQEYCDQAAVLHAGSLTRFNNLPDAFEFYARAAI